MSYFDVKAISNSALNALDPEMGGSPAKFKKYLDGIYENKESLSLERGSLLHSWLEHQDNFIVAELDKPTGQMGAYVESYYKNLIGGYDETSASEIAYAEVNSKKYKLETMQLEFLKPEYQEYFNFLKEANNKNVLNKFTKDILSNCQESIRNNKVAWDLITRLSSHKEEEIFWKDNFGLDRKGKIDHYYIDHNTKKVYLTDYKTTSKSAYNFKETLDYWRYYRQMANYIEAIIAKYPEVELYGLETNIIVCETFGDFNCVVYNIDSSYIEKGEDELWELLKRAKWHIDNDIWNQSKEEHPQGYINLSFTKK